MFVEFDEKLISVRSIKTINRSNTFDAFQIVITEYDGDVTEESYKDKDKRDERYQNIKDELT